MNENLSLYHITLIETLQRKIEALKKELKEAREPDEINEFTLIHTETA